jgi:Ca2+-dependent lipid-binding protein
MKLPNILGQTNQSFASVFFAFSLFGFLFSHHAKQVKQNHHTNLTTTEQATQQESADDGSQYEWFY